MYSQFINFEFGWLSEDPKKPTLSDYIINGQYCKSGLAYLVEDQNVARCAETVKIMQGNKTLLEP